MDWTEEGERTYAGVLGKIIGVYFGGPVEGWTYENPQDEFGEIEYYPNGSRGHTARSFRTTTSPARSCSCERSLDS